MFVCVCVRARAHVGTTQQNLIERRVRAGPKRSSLSARWWAMGALEAAADAAAERHRRRRRGIRPPAPDRRRRSPGSRAGFEAAV